MDVNRGDISYNMEERVGAVSKASKFSMLLKKADVIPSSRKAFRAFAWK